MKTLPNNWVIKKNSNQVAQASLNIILEAAQKAIQSKGEFKIVLAGGTTPKIIYVLLAKENCDWKNWRIYLGDERCLPIDNPERNSHMIYESFLNKVDIQQKNIHFISSELGAESASFNYEKNIKNTLPFDLVLLGMGEDGHTASLFPTHKFNEDELVHAVTSAPKPPSDRVSLSAKALSLNKQLLIIITGRSKQQAVHAWLSGEVLPVNQIRSLGKEIVLLDKAAINIS